MILHVVDNRPIAHYTMTSCKFSRCRTLSGAVVATCTPLAAELCAMSDMSSSSVAPEAFLLSEDDIPGASLGGRDPGELGVAELKRWLQCRAAKRDGKKPELLKRYVNDNS